MFKNILSFVIIISWIELVHSREVQIKILGDPGESQSVTAIWEHKPEKKKIFGFLSKENDYYAADTKVGTNLAVEFPFIKEEIALSKLILKRSGCSKEFIIESDIIQKISQKIGSNIEFQIETINEKDCFQIINTTMDLDVSKKLNNPFNPPSQNVELYKKYLLELENRANLSQEYLDEILEKIEILTDKKRGLGDSIEEIKLANHLVLKLLALRTNKSSENIKHHLDKLQRLEVRDFKVNFLELDLEFTKRFDQVELEFILKNLIEKNFYFESFFIAGELVKKNIDQRMIVELFPSIFRNYLIDYLFKQKPELKRSDIEMILEVTQEQEDQEKLILRYFGKFNSNNIEDYFWLLDLISKTHTEKLALTVFERMPDISPQNLLKLSSYMANSSYFLQISYEKVNDKSFESLISVLDAMENFYVGTLVQDFMSQTKSLSTERLIKISSYDEFSPEYFIKTHLDLIDDLDFLNLKKILKLADTHKEEIISFFMDKQNTQVSTTEIIQLAEIEGWSKSKFILKYMDKVNDLDSENLNLLIAQVDGLSKNEVQKFGETLINQVNPL